MSGRSSIIEIDTELWNDFSLAYIEKQLQGYSKKQTQPAVEEVATFKRLETNNLRFVKEPLRTHIENCYKEMDRKDVIYTKLEKIRRHYKHRALD